jgi:hypothetical protein
MNRRSSRSHGFKRWRTNRNNGIQIVDAKDEKIMVSAPTRSDDVSVFFFWHLKPENQLTAFFFFFFFYIWPSRRAVWQLRYRRAEHIFPCVFHFFRLKKKCLDFGDVSTFKLAGRASLVSRWRMRHSCFFRDWKSRLTRYPAAVYHEFLSDPRHQHDNKTSQNDQRLVGIRLHHVIL